MRGRICVAPYPARCSQMTWCHPSLRTVGENPHFVRPIPNRLALVVVPLLLESCGSKWMTSPIHGRSLLAKFVSVVERFRVLVSQLDPILVGKVTVVVLGVVFTLDKDL